MDGKTHFIVGGITGIGVANYVNVDLPTAISLTILGGFVGLVPDLDVKGTLSTKISLNKKWLISILGLLGLLLLVNSFNLTTNRWLSVCYGIALLVAPSFIIKQKMMLLLTGLVVLIGGVYLQIIWMIMLGIYISIASRLSHRSLTHSLLGLAYFSVLGYYLEIALQIHGITLVCTVSYVSHLILDMKFLPKNRKGVKLFQPFSKFEL